MTPSDHLPATTVGQPLEYPPRREYVEPDWNRVPGFQGVSRAEWESATWQRRHTIKNLREFKAALRELLPDHPPPALPLTVLYPQQRQMPARLRVFIDWLAELSAGLH